jgi:hypothetical protein
MLHLMHQFENKYDGIWSFLGGCKGAMFKKESQQHKTIYKICKNNLQLCCH